MQAYQAELKDYTPELPTITFDKSYLLRDAAYDLHIEFHGHAHTSGDVVVYCPQARAVATGDVIHGFLPNIADGFPRLWPAAIDSIGGDDFNTILPGHAALQTGRTQMVNLRNYIEELTGRVEESRKAGQSLAEMQQRITVASLKSLHSNGYEDYLARMRALSNSPFSKLTAVAKRRKREYSRCLSQPRPNLVAAAKLGKQPQDLEVQPNQRDHKPEGAVPLHILWSAHPCATLDEVEIKD